MCNILSLGLKGKKKIKIRNVALTKSEQRNMKKNNRGCKIRQGKKKEGVNTATTKYHNKHCHIIYKH